MSRRLWIVGLMVAGLALRVAVMSPPFAVLLRVAWATTIGPLVGHETMSWWLAIRVTAWWLALDSGKDVFEGIVESMFVKKE